MASHDAFLSFSQSYRYGLVLDALTRHTLDVRALTYRTRTAVYRRVPLSKNKHRQVIRQIAFEYPTARCSIPAEYGCMNNTVQIIDTGD